MDEELRPRQKFMAEGKEFVHFNRINTNMRLLSEDSPLPQQFIAECHSYYPQMRCSCGMFDLDWMIQR